MTFRIDPPRIPAWARLGRAVVADYPVFSVERVTLETPSPGPQRTVAPRDFFTLGVRDWANVVAVTEDGHVVMVWQYRFGTDALSLETPGGVLDEGEAPEEAARRELLEETGYAADVFEPLLAVEPNPALQGNVCHSFVARGARKVREPAFDDAEELEVVRVPVGDLPALLDGGHVRHGLIVAALERFLRNERR